MAKFAHAFLLVLSEKVTLPNGRKEHKEVGRCNVPFPTLADFGIQAEQAVQKDDKGNAVVGADGKPVLAFEDGVPLFADQKMDWLQQAIVFKHQAAVRNKFTKGKLKPGMSLPEDFESLLEQVGRSGEALALRREAKASFEAFLQSCGKSAGTVATLTELFANSAKMLSSASPKYIEGLAVQVTKWVESLSDEHKARFAPKITELNDSINSAQGEEDLDDMTN